MISDDTQPVSGVPRPRSRRFWAALAAFVLVFSGVAAAGFATAPASEAASAGDFKAGNLISDENFYDGNAMSASEVQAFLGSKVSSCAGGAYPCLRDYRQNTPSMAGDRYCSPMQAVANDSAAGMIARIGQACSISQKAMLVLLEKEQGIVTASSPGSWAYNAATGFSCPDTAPCDPSVGGFFYQVYYAARQFQVYKAQPYYFNHIPFQTNGVRYSPNASCGSGSVYIENYATAGLYNYTPYQPNSAALNNLYGTGDGCSAYGNRNFWRMYTDWFGDPRGASDAYLMRADGDAKVFLIGDGVKYHVPDPSFLDAYSSLGSIRVVSQATLNAYRDGGELSRVARGDDGGLWLVDQGQRHHFETCEAASSYGYSCWSYSQLPERVLSRLTVGNPMWPVAVMGDGTNFVVQSGTKREVPDTSVLTSIGFPMLTVRLSEAAVGHLPYGTPVVRGGMNLQGADWNQSKIATSDGYGQVKSPLAYLGFGGTITRVRQGSYDAASVSSEYAPRMSTPDGQVFVATSSGPVKVSPQSFSSLAPTSTVTDAAISVFGNVDDASNGAFFRDIDSSNVSGVVAGTRYDVSSPADRTAVIKLGATDTDYIVPNGATGTMTPTPLPVSSGALVYVPDDRRVYVVDGSTLHYVPSFEYTRAAGLGSAARAVTRQQLEAIGAVGPDFGGYLLRCGDEDVLAANGAVAPLAAGVAASDFGRTPVELGSALCDVLTGPSTSSAPASGLLRAPDGRIFIAEDGGLRHIPNVDVLAAMGGFTTGWTEVAQSVIDWFPAGPPIDERAAYVDGSLIYAAEDHRVYVVDGDDLLYVPSFTYSEAWGLGGFSQTRQVPKTVIDSYASKTGRLDTTTLQCGDTTYAAIGGTVYRLDGPDDAPSFGSRVGRVDSGLCARFSVADETVSSFLEDADGTVYFVDAGTLRHVPDEGTLTSLGGADRLRPLPAAIKAALPTGESMPARTN